MIALDDTAYTEGIQRAATVSILCGALACLASILLALVLHTELSNWIQTHCPGNASSAGYTAEARGCSTVKIEASHIDCASLSLSVLILITGMQCSFVASDTDGLYIECRHHVAHWSIKRTQQCNGRLVLTGSNTRYLGTYHNHIDPKNRACN